MNTFEITIQRKEGDSWPIVAEYSHPDTLLPLRSEGRLQLSQEDFQELTSLLGGPKQYGRKLGRALFQEDVRDAFVRAVYESEEPLRVLLFIEASDLQLRTLRWERLCAPIENDWRQLATNQRALFSLYIPSITERRFQPMGRRDLRALVLVASPESLGRYQLAPFDVEAAISGVRQALGEIKCDVLANVAGAIGMPTLDELCKQLTNREKRYSLLHFVCHGRVIDGGETVLYWANADNQVEPVKGTRLLERLSSLNGPKGLPHFAFLCSCETASPEAEGALGGLGQRLVRNLGMPAVVAMTEPVSVKTALALGESFYRQLTQSGEVDLALREATAGLAERDDITVPALFSRLGGRPLFSDQRYRDLTNSEIQFGLSRLETLLSERAPILSNKFDQQKTVLEETLGAEATALSNQARQERKKALEEVNNLCDRVLDLSFAALALDKEPPAYDSRCPFRGLQSFRPEDREFFFGREALIEKLQQKLAEHNFLAVLGTSGSGKSSVVLAGLIPAVQKNQPDLQMTYMTPNSEPLVQLNASLLKVHNQPSVLVVDQFEELFTLCTDEAKRVEFINQLLTLAQQQKVVVTMRADFWGECAKYHKLKELMQRRQELMGPMDSAELRRAMEMQAAKVGLRFEADLSNTILDDVQGEPGAMPLLQHALQEMWKRRHGRWLRCQEYRAIGGVQQAIAQTADNFYEKLSSQEKKQVRNIFVRLTRLDEDAVQGEKRRDTRQRVSLEDLVPAGGESVVTKKLVQRLADDRLIITSVNKVTDKEEVEVAHEALIRYWPKLQKWLDEDLVSIRLCKTISQAAHEWDKNRRDDNFLVHQGGRLEDADTLRKQSRLPLSQLEREYVDACVERRDRLFKEKEARNLVFVVNDLLKKDLTKALRMAQVAYCLDSSHTLPQVSQALSTAYYSVIASRSGLYVANQPHKDAVITAIYAPDSQKILTACKDGTAKLWDSRGKFLKAMEQGAQITSASFSHDGSKIVTVGYDHLVKMWDGEGNYIKDLVGHESDSMGHSDVKSVAFSPDDQTIVTVSVDHKVIMWDGQGNKKKELNDHEDPVGYVTFSPNGEYFVTCGLWRDSTAKLYDKDGNLIASLGMDTGESKKLNSWEWGITSAAFSLDNQFLVTTSHDFTAKMWDINGNHLKTLEEHQADVNQVVFSPDGNLFITVSDDKTAIIWDRQGNKCEILKGHEDSINSIAFSPDGNLVVTGGADCGAKLWHLNGNVLVNFRGHSSSINSVAFSPDGQYIVTASTDRTSKIWKVQPTIHTPHFDHDDEVIAAKFTPDGSKILTASNDLTVKLWDVKTNQLLKIYEGFDCDDYGNSRIYSLDVSPDGQRFITTGTDYTIRIWDIESGEIVQSWDGGHRYSCTPNGWCGATNARYSPDGKYIITCDFGGRVKLWDNEGNCAKELKGPDEPESHKMEVNGIDISKDNKYIATPGTEEKVVRLWDFQTGELLREFKGHSAAVNQVIFAHDGQSLLTASEDQTAKLWDLQGNILLNIEGHADTVRTAAFSPTGEYIITASHDRTAKIWNRQGKLVNTLTGHSEYLRSAYFSPDGQTVVTASEDRTAQVWSLAESIYSQLCNLDANIYHLTAADMEEYGIDVPLPYL